MVDTLQAQELPLSVTLVTHLDLNQMQAHVFACCDWEPQPPTCRVLGKYTNENCNFLEIAYGTQGN